MIDSIDLFDRFPSQLREAVRQSERLLASIANVSQWITKLDALASSLGKDPFAYSSAEQHLFELKVMAFIAGKVPGLRLTYEPKGIISSGKNVDIQFTTTAGSTLLELKAFHPVWKSKPTPFDYITERNDLRMNPELYHQYEAVREHLLDEVIDSELKMANYPAGKRVVGLWTSFYLDIEEVRDFITIYYTSRSSPDDPLGKMTLLAIEKEGKDFLRTIDEFWCFPF